MELKKMSNIYMYDDEKELIKSAISMLNKNREKGQAKVTISNFAVKCSVDKAKDILKDIEKGK